MAENKENDLSEVLEVASEAGHVLLENGAEIARVEETMERVATYFGAQKKSFFVLSNGIFTTGSLTKTENNPAAREVGSYANVEFIPLKGTQMEKIVEINALSRDVEAGKYTLAETAARVKQIRNMPAKAAWEQLLGSAFGSAGFCVLFGGGFIDSLAAFVVGLVLWAFVLLVSRPGVSKILINIVGGGLASLLCYAFYHMGFGQNLGNMMIGSLIPLIPGVPFTNGIRDVANEDYIAGATRLLDALMVFLGIALGVSIFFVLESHITSAITGSVTHVLELHGSTADPLTANVPIQTLAALIGTVGFAVLFGVPRRQYVAAGVVAAIGWAMYYAIYKYTSLSIVENTFLTSLLVSFVSRLTAVLRKCPVTVFLICGLFPMIPGAGVFWTTYYVTSRQFLMALNQGVLAVSITLAIVLAVVIITALPRTFKLRQRLRFGGRV